MTASTNSVHNNAVHIISHFKRNAHKLYPYNLCAYIFSLPVGKSRGESSGTLTYVALRNKYSVLDFAPLIFLAYCAIMGQSLFRAATLHPLRDEGDDRI